MVKASSIPPENHEDEDQRFSEALQLVLRKRSVWPGMLSGYLKFSYQDADRCIDKMRTLGILDADGKVNSSWQPTRGAPLTAPEKREEAAKQERRAELEALRESERNAKAAATASSSVVNNSHERGAKPAGAEQADECQETAAAVGKLETTEVQHPVSKPDPSWSSAEQSGKTAGRIFLLFVLIVVLIVVWVKVRSP